MDSGRPTWFETTLQTLQSRQDLSERCVDQVMTDLMAGACGDPETAALLTAWRDKGETAEEIAAAARVLRRHMVRVDTGPDDVLDTCGTGGDETQTFNISTATAFVVAGAGVRVVKHGNRSVSSRSGSADVLAELGVMAQSDPVRIKDDLDRAGLAFCFAPHFHPAMKHVAAVRRRLGFRTIFNCLGPLANPAAAARQLLGVGKPELLERMAAALAILGAGRAFLVNGHDGLDEVSLAGPTEVREVQGHTTTSHTWTPADFGLAPVALAELRVAGPAESAQVIRGTLDGKDSGALRIVLANAAAALVAAGKAANLAEGVRQARVSVERRQARQVLERLIPSGS